WWSAASCRAWQAPAGSGCCSARSTRACSGRSRSWSPGGGGTSWCTSRWRPVPFAGHGPVPAGLERRGDRPRLLVSHSTVPGPGGNTLRPVLAAVDGLDAEVVVLRAPEGPLPANVRPVGWVPLPALLPHADAIVHHGGAGTVLAALAFGVPQL